MSTRIPANTARRRLATVWFSGAGFLFGILMLQSLLGRYGRSAEEVWNWFLPSVVPTLTLVVGVLVSDALGHSGEQGEVDRFIFRLALVLSVSYLLVLTLPIVIAPFSERLPSELFQASRLWIMPFQGLVSAALGAFFVNKK
ncbi:MAG: hypothetical protein ACREYF_29295 [Gammaproteobacteria bacterium]